ncbi:MAG: DNA polymerase III subunit gamma/tau [Lysobacteraceae bacterium]
MSYLVLARKWRPRRFAELVGQEHVVRALSNALESGRVHHAYLFTGTRGVGKTTIARIFAKSLNCETGVGADPCGECAVCTAVDAGRFVDLLEIDAASNTGVDDVREVIENAQYMPTRGRYKVYLIDEVHMLSKAAFNALLKTLEEPPEHVKFLLATTDPDKLPVTVLSRCLQFNLKRLSEEQIAEQMRKILSAESIAFEDVAIQRLSHAADGSLRDGLSLLDQAIAYGAGSLALADVDSMLGTVDRGEVDGMLAAVAAGDGPGLMQAIEHHAGYSPEFAATLEAMAERLHQTQLAQLVDGMAPVEALPEVLLSLPPETVQLWYQMALQGRRDLYLAPSPRIGFEMTMLRMLAFLPDDGSGARAESRTKPGVASAVAAASRLAESAASPAKPPAAAPATPMLEPNPVATQESRPPMPEPQPVSRPAPVSTYDAEPAARQAPPATIAERDEPPKPKGQVLGIADNAQWVALLSSIELRGPMRELAGNTTFISLIDRQLKLAMPASHMMLAGDMMTRQLAGALTSYLGFEPVIRIEQARADAATDTLSARDRAQQDARQQDAEAAFMADPGVQGLINDYGARVAPGSIKPLPN